MKIFSTLVVTLSTSTDRSHPVPSSPSRNYLDSGAHKNPHRPRTYRPRHRQVVDPVPRALKVLPVVRSCRLFHELSVHNHHYGCLVPPGPPGSLSSVTPRDERLYLSYFRSPPTCLRPQSTVFLLVLGSGLPVWTQSRVGGQVATSRTPWCRSII